MNRTKTIGALAIAAAASSAILASPAAATDVSISGTCELRDGLQALVVTYQAQGWAAGARLEEVAARDGFVFDTATLPVAESLTKPGGYSLPQSREVLAYLPSPQASVHATGSIAAYLPGGVEAYRTAVLDSVLACPGLTPTAPGTEAARVEPLPVLVKVPAPRKAVRRQRPQRPRVRMLTACRMRGVVVSWPSKPRSVRSVRGADGRFYPVTKRNGLCGPVAGYG
jgi:hypothetical protein